MLRKLEISDIDQCVAIHMKNSIDWSHNAHIGERHLKNIYEVIFSCEESFGVGYFNSEGLVCYITVTTDYFTTMKKLYRLVSFKHYGKLIRHVLKDPNELMDMLEAKFVLPKVIKRLRVDPQILTWHNDFDQKDHQTAPILVFKKALSELNGLGFDSCTAQVDPSNRRPNVYYESINAPLRYSSRWNKLYEVFTSE